MVRPVGVPYEVWHLSVGRVGRDAGQIVRHDGPRVHGRLHRPPLLGWPPGPPGAEQRVVVDAADDKHPLPPRQGGGPPQARVSADVAVIGRHGDEYVLVHGGQVGGEGVEEQVRQVDSGRRRRIVRLEADEHVLADVHSRFTVLDSVASQEAFALLLVHENDLLALELAAVAEADPHLRVAVEEGARPRLVDGARVVVHDGEPRRLPDDHVENLAASRLGARPRLLGHLDARYQAHLVVQAHVARGRANPRDGPCDGGELAPVPPLTITMFKNLETSSTRSSLHMILDGKLSSITAHTILNRVSQLPTKNALASCLARLCERVSLVCKPDDSVHGQVFFFFF